MRQKQSGNVVGVIFACFFLIPGLVVMLISFVPVYQYLATQNWQEVNAYLIEVKQVSSRNDSSTSYGVTGHYRYNFEGDSFQSDSLSFYGGTDNLGSFQKQFYRKLKNAQTKNAAVTAWVDPASPEDAYIDRTLRGGVFAFKFLFGLVFTAVGGGILLLSRFAKKRSLETARLADSYPEEPWKWRPEWQTNIVRPNAGLQFKTLIFFTVIWNLISIPSAALVFFGEKPHPIGIKLLILIFPFIGLFLVYMATMAYRTWKKYGAATLRMKSVPFFIGGNSAGEITIPGVDLGEDFILTLSCLQKTRKRSGKKTRTHTKILWQGDRRVKSGPGSDNVANLDYAFSIPANLPESKERENNKSIEWKMLCQGEGDSSLKLEFEVPAFVADKLNATAGLSGENHSTWNEDTLKVGSDSYALTTGDWTHLGVVQSKKEGGTHYYFSSGRNLKFSIPIPVFGVVFTTAAVGLYLADAPFLFVLMSGAFGLLFLYLGVQSLFFRSEIRIADEKMHVRRGVLKMRHRATCSVSDIHEFDISSNIRSSETRVYRLSVKLLDGEKVLLGKNLLVKSDVESLINQIQLDLGFLSKHGKTS